MSTRAIIAKPTGDGFSGRYHHSDGYPNWLGRVLWRRLHDGKTTMDYLLNSHPAGWSILADPDYPLTKIPKSKWGKRESWDNNQDACYCHGGPYIGVRSEEASDLIREDDDCGQEWAYVIAENWFTVLVVAGRPDDDGMGAYRVCWSGPLNGPEPDWALVQANGLRLAGY